MKRIFITESQEEILKKMVKESLSSESSLTMKDLYESTPLKDLIPERYSEKLLEQRGVELSKIINKLFPSLDLDNVSYDDITSKLMVDIIKKEEKIKEFLEKLCYDSLFEIFTIPEGIVDVECNLVNKIENDKSFIHITPSSPDVELETYTDAVDLDKEINKRKLLNLFIIGASIVLTRELLTIKKEEIKKLDSSIYDSYRRLLWVNEYNLSKKLPEITDDNHQQGGVVLVKLGNEKRQTQITSKGQCLPILIYEAMKGMFELFISHGLPTNREYAEYVIDQSDLLKYESVSLVIGPILWNNVMSIMTANNIDTNILPFFFQNLSLMDSDSLTSMTQEILLKTKKGKQQIEDMLLSIQDEIDYDEFETRMKTKRDEKNILNDNEYMSDEELI